MILVDTNILSTFAKINKLDIFMQLCGWPLVRHVSERSSATFQDENIAIVLVVLITIFIF